MRKEKLVWKKMTISPEKTANETEIIYNWLSRANLPHKDFKALVIRKERLGERIDEQSEDFNKEPGNIKKNKSELKNTINETKSTIEGINNRLGDAEEYISDLEDRIMGIIHRRVKRKTNKMKTN